MNTITLTPEQSQELLRTLRQAREEIDIGDPETAETLLRMAIESLEVKLSVG